MAKKELAKKAAVVRATTKEDKKTALDGALKQIEKNTAQALSCVWVRQKRSTLTAFPQAR